MFTMKARKHAREPIPFVHHESPKTCQSAHSICLLSVPMQARARSTPVQNVMSASNKLISYPSFSIRGFLLSFLLLLLSMNPPYLSLSLSLSLSLRALLLDYSVSLSLSLSQSCPIRLLCSSFSLSLSLSGSDSLLSFSSRMYIQRTEHAYF